MADYTFTTDTAPDRQTIDFLTTSGWGHKDGDVSKTPQLGSEVPVTVGGYELLGHYYIFSRPHFHLSGDHTGGGDFFPTDWEWEDSTYTGAWPAPCKWDSDSITSANGFVAVLYDSGGPNERTCWNINTGSHFYYGTYPYAAVTPTITVTAAAAGGSDPVQRDILSGATLSPIISEEIIEYDVVSDH